MFPQVEAEVLEEVAAAVGGQIEAAVEALIGMGCDGGAGEGQPLLQGPGAGEHARDEEGPVKQVKELRALPAHPFASARCFSLLTQTPCHPFSSLPLPSPPPILPLSSLSLPSPCIPRRALLGSATHPSFRQEATKGPCTHVSEPTEGYGGRWGALPQECKLLILGELTMKDLARAARTCWELAAHARSAFANRRAISIPPGEAQGLGHWFTSSLCHLAEPMTSIQSPPPSDTPFFHMEGLSFPQMQGMCAAHVSALRVSLHPCRHQLANPYDFQRAFDAIAGGTKVTRPFSPLHLNSSLYQDFPSYRRP